MTRSSSPFLVEVDTMTLDALTSFADWPLSLPSLCGLLCLPDNSPLTSIVLWLTSFELSVIDCLREVLEPRFGTRLRLVFSINSLACCCISMKEMGFVSPSFNTSLLWAKPPPRSSISSAFDWVCWRDVEPPATVAISSPLLAFELMKSRLKFLPRLFNRDEPGLGRRLRFLPPVEERFVAWPLSF